MASSSNPADAAKEAAEMVKRNFSVMPVVYAVLYMTVAATIVLANKYVVSVTPFVFPITLSSLGKGGGAGFTPA